MRSSFIPGPGICRLTILEEDESHVVLTYENVIAVLWRGPLKPRTCEGLYDLAIRLARIQGTRQVAAIAIAEEGSAPPNRLARLALERLHEDPSNVIFRMAFVHHRRGGFFEATVRSVILGLRRRLSRHDNQGIFQTIEAALQWATDGLGTAKGTPVDVPTLVRELAAYREHEQSKPYAIVAR